MFANRFETPDFPEQLGLTKNIDLLTKRAGAPKKHSRLDLAFERFAKEAAIRH